MLEKIFKSIVSWDMCQNVIGQSDYRIFKTTISLEQNHEKVWVFDIDTNSLKLKVGWKILGWACS